MSRFFDRNLRFPIVFQLVSVAAFIYITHLFFTHFIDRPSYQKSFFEFHAARADPFVDLLSTSLADEILNEDGIFLAKNFNQFDNRPGIADALIIDCAGNIYISKNSALTGNSILSSNTLSLSESLSYLEPNLYSQVANTGVSISRDIASEKRLQLSSLPCLEQKQSQFQHAVLLVFFDWSQIIDTSMSLVNDIMLNERIKWALVLVVVFVVTALSLIPRTLRLKNVITEAAEGNFHRTYQSQGFDELDLIGQSFDEMVGAFHKRLSSVKEESEKLGRGYAAFEQSNQAICILSADQRVVDINSAYEKLTGYTAGEMIGRALVSILPGEFLVNEDSDSVDKDFIDGPAREVWGFKKNGVRFRKTIRLSSHQNSDGKIGGYFLAIRDTTTEYEQREKLEILAKTDPLTGIYNRRKFDLDLNGLLESGNRNFAIGIINLDSMKEINSEYGKRSGNKVINEVGRRLLLTVSGNNNRVYRFEGDEFYVLFDNIEYEHELERQARTVLSSLVGEIKFTNIHIEITAGMGAAMFDGSANGTPHEQSNLMLNHANLALRHAKTNGRSKVVVAKDYVLLAERRKLSISLALKSSKLTEQLQLSYLPKVDIRHGILTGAEAIVRWDCPQIGFIPIDELMPIAETTGDIERIDEWVIENALRDAAKFIERIDGFQTSIKISSQQLQNESFVSSFLRQLRKHGVPAESIALEIAEREPTKNQKTLVSVLKKLRSEGISIHMEDFGIGYSSLLELQELPLDALKIKKLYLEGQPNLKIIQAIISLARAMKMPVIAGGVESTYHLNLLKEMGCDFCLGYVYSEPVTLNQDTGADTILSVWQKSIDAITP